MSDWPRPFVVRAGGLDGATYSQGQEFGFDFHLFDMHQPAIATLVEAFGELARVGIGPGRGRTDLVRVECLGETGEAKERLYEAGREAPREPAEPIALSLDAEAEAVERVVVQFVTPTELKSGQRLAERPEFGVLAARMRDRLSTLRELYDDGPLALDFRGFGERAARIKMLRWDVRHVEATRRSSRTGQAHGIGGFVGEAEYAGDLREFMPFLRAARWTGVGRQTVWGKGEIAIAGGAGRASNWLREPASVATNDLVV